MTTSDATATTLSAISPYAIQAASAAHTNRTRWTVDNHRAATLVHDTQGYFVGGLDRSDRQPQINATLRNIGRSVEVPRAQEVPPFCPAKPPDQSAHERGLLADFWSAGLTANGREAIVSEPAPERHGVLMKWRHKSFARTDLRDQLHKAGRDQLVVTGVHAHIGCPTTALVAFMDDRQAFSAPDSTTSLSAEKHLPALDYACTRQVHEILSDLATTRHAPSRDQAALRSGYLR